VLSPLHENKVGHNATLRWSCKNARFLEVTL